MLWMLDPAHELAIPTLINVMFCYQCGNSSWYMPEISAVL